MKLYVSKVTIATEFMVAKFFLQAGLISEAEDCKNILWVCWNKLNCGLIDVEDIQFLYKRLHILTTNIHHAKAKAYDKGRESCGKM